MARIFISYARDDGLEIAKELADRLRATGHEVFLDVQSILAGAQWRTELDKRITWSDLIVVMVTESSNDSDYVYKEITEAAKQGKIVVPIQVNNTPLPVYLRGTWQAVALKGNDVGSVLGELERSIQQLPETKSNSLNRRIFFAISIIAIALLAAFLVLSSLNEDDKNQAIESESVAQLTEEVIPPRATHTLTITKTSTLEQTSTPTTSPTVTPTRTPRPTNTPNPTATFTSTATQIPKAAILYEENFEDNAADGWFIYAGTWEVVEEQDGNNVYSGKGLFGNTFLKPLGWENYVVELRLKANPFDAEIFLRSYGWDLGYVLKFEGNNIILMKKINEDVGDVIWFWSYTFVTPQDWTTVHIELDGPIIRVNVDGQWYPEVQDSTYAEGGVGVFTSSRFANHIIVDDVRIWSLDEE